MVVDFYNNAQLVLSIFAFLCGKLSRYVLFIKKRQEYDFPSDLDNLWSNKEEKEEGGGGVHSFSKALFMLSPKTNSVHTRLFILSTLMHIL